MRRFFEHRAAGMGGYIRTTPDETTFMAECLACGVQKEVTRDALKKAVRGLEGLRHLGKRLRCQACGERNGKLMTGFYAEDDDAPGA